jgi:hypothetical protein
MQKPISLHLSSSSFLFYVGMTSCALLTLILAFLWHLLYAYATLNIVFSCLVFLMGGLSLACLLIELSNQKKFSRQDHLRVTFMQGVWSLNGNNLKALELLFRSSYGILVLVDHNNKKYGRYVIWISNRLNNDAEIRRLSRCFE